MASGGRIRRIPVTGSPRRLLGRSPIERSTAGVRVPSVDCSVRDIAAANQWTVTSGVATVMQCCHCDGIGPRESSVSHCWRVRRLPWLPDCSGCHSACAGPGASVRTLYTIVPHCQEGERGNFCEVAKWTSASSTAGRPRFGSWVPVRIRPCDLVPCSAFGCSHWRAHPATSRRPQKVMVDCLTLSRGVCRTPRTQGRDASCLAPRVGRSNEGRDSQ